LQTLELYGYIEILLTNSTMRKNALDLNKDGKVSQEHYCSTFDKLMGVLTYNMSAVPLSVVPRRSSRIKYEGLEITAKGQPLVAVIN
jgi:hypothetical protein